MTDALDGRDEPASPSPSAATPIGSDEPAHPLARYALAADRGLEGDGSCSPAGEGHVFPEPETFGR